MTATRPPLRLWPGIVLAGLLLFGWTILPLITPDASNVLVGVAGAAAIALWWVLFSRAPWLERLAVLAAGIAVFPLIVPLLDPSIVNGGNGVLSRLLWAPALALAIVVWAVVGERLARGPRWIAFAACLVVAAGTLIALRTDGVRAGSFEMQWRWTPTAEERLLARGEDLPMAAAAPVSTGEAPDVDRDDESTRAGAAPGTEASGPPAEGGARDEAPPASASAEAPGGTPATATPETIAADAAAPTPSDAAPEVTRVAWPGFRGEARDGIVRDTGIDTDWVTTPPAVLWRRPIGPGWSSFAVGDGLIYTQEQRGDHEVVACYRLATGEPVWHHRDAVRFWESNGGAGPRATPTLHEGRIFAFGATGILNALDAATGVRLWTRDVAAETGREVPGWGFASSPLVIDDLVVVAAAGTLAAYDRATGAPRWQGPSYGGSYSSPHRVVIEGVAQVVLLGGPGAMAVDPATGAVLWIHEWAPGPMVQPALLPDGDLLVNAVAMTGGSGIRRLRLTQDAGAWQMSEQWTTNGLKPYFNDFVVHEGYAYGFDGSILSAIDLTDGRRVWKGGRYGNGQMVLLADQDLLLVLSEDGELVLVSATPDAHAEIARAPALNAKTWNHPVVIGDLLLVRNGEEMAAFRLPIPALTTTR